MCYTLFDYLVIVTKTIPLSTLDSSQSVAVFENYLRILSSSILSDLGIALQSNLMANTDLFKQFLVPVDFSYRGALVTMSGNTSQVNTVLANMSSFNLPFTSIQSTRLNTQYLCHYQAWKTGTNLVTDVCVATASLFMVFWGGLKLALAFLAKRASIDGENFILSLFLFS